MAEKLKPCPFCSRKVNVYIIPKFWGYRWQVRCLWCGASAGYADNKKEAIENWDRRVKN